MTNKVNSVFQNCSFDIHKKIRLDILCETSTTMIHMKCQDSFLVENIKKNVLKVHCCGYN